MKNNKKNNVQFLNEIDKLNVKIAKLEKSGTGYKQAKQALHHHNQELTTLLDVSKTLVSTLNMKTVLQATTDSIARYLELETSAVYLLEGDKLHLWATTPPLPPDIPDSFCIALLSNHPHIEETISKKQSRFILDTKSALFSAHEKEIIEARDVRSILYLPLITEQKVLGVLLVGSMGIPRDITDSKIESCSTLANIASLAIANTQLYIYSQSNVANLEREVTKRKQAENKLRESEERFRKLFDSAHDALMTLNPPTWKFTSGNPAILKMFKIKNVEEFLTYDPWNISPEKQPDGRLSSEKAKEMIEIAMTKGSNYFEWTHKRINGKSFPATVLLTKIQLKDETFLQATVRDITERKQAEEKLKSRNKELELFTEVTVGRELKMIELKKEINELLEKSGEKLKYEIPV